MVSDLIMETQLGCGGEEEWEGGREREGLHYQKKNRGRKDHDVAAEIRPLKKSLMWTEKLLVWFSLILIVIWNECITVHRLF